tara:strand:+ start:1516 stop:2295 length:780 start_codon:yes stop_codon:yes gene_type:complete
MVKTKPVVSGNKGNKWWPNVKFTDGDPPPFSIYKTLLDKRSCEYIIDKMESKLVPAKTMHNSDYHKGEVTKPQSSINPNTRKSKTAWVTGDRQNTLYVDKEIATSLEVIDHMVHRVNNERWNLSIESHPPPVQFTKYDIGDFYNWHRDGGMYATQPLISEKYVRKISYTLLLSQPEKHFTGGEFCSGLNGVDRETEEGAVIHKNRASDQLLLRSTCIPHDELTQGSLIVFLSPTLHKVTPVITGTRYSLVGWFEGPLYR